ncbi:MAG: hypothetical protein E4H14_09770 [Candidatus Thorarchaeota archaeon]|nr:MAG: hypothetical protein E4H14_09770 [Candidatus Thorarchaeota archaeon]
MSNDWDNKVRTTIEGFPEPHRQELLQLWNEWLETNPESPLYKSWATFSSGADDEEALYTERRVYFKRVRNDLRDIEVPLKGWQKVAKVLAAVASVFLVLFLALSRVFRATE